MSVLATIVDWNALGQTALAALIAGVGTALFFSIGILGVARATDTSREPGLLGAIGFGLLAFLGLAGTAAAIAFGLIEMI